MKWTAAIVRIVECIANDAKGRSKILQQKINCIQLFIITWFDVDYVDSALKKYLPCHE